MKWSSATPEDHGEKATPSLPHSPSSLASDSFTQMTLVLLKDLGAGRQLLEFCLSLPVFKTLTEENRDFLSVKEGADPASTLANAVKRYAINALHIHTSLDHNQHLISQ